MKSSSRLGWIVLALIIGAAPSLSSAQPLTGDDRLAGQDPAVPVPREIAKALADAEEQLTQQQYPTAVGLLQSILETPEDYLLPANGEFPSVKQRVLFLLRTLPPDGLQAYRLQYEAQAAALWRRYQADGDPAIAVRIGRRYPMSAAAFEARSLLATLAFDRNEPLTAARWWDEVVASSTPRLEQVAAWSFAGRTDHGRELLAKLIESDADFRLAGRRLSADELAQTFADWQQASKSVQARPATEWQTFRGNAARNATALPAGPIGGPAWSRDTLSAAAGSFEAEQPSDEAPAMPRMVAEIEDQLRLDDRVRLPGLHPLVVQGMAVFRTAEYVVAVDVATGELRWRTPVPYSQLHSVASGPTRADRRESVRETQITALRQRLYRDRTTGTLSSDGVWVYAVEPSPEMEPGDPFGGLPTPPLVANKLTAYDVQTGRMVWELGGRRTAAGDALAGCFFQGPPLVVGDHLYCIAEMNGEQRLLQFRRTFDSPGVQLEWSQVLASPQGALGWSPLRMWSGQSPSFAGDILICPTTAGMVVAVDPARRLLLWGYRYAAHNIPSAQQRGPVFNVFPLNEARPLVDEEDGYWADSASTIVGTRVLLTPRDSRELHCVDALTGESLWVRPREQGLYVAGVYRDRVLIVGRESMAARNLADGSLVWEQPIPMPAGRGLMLPDRYLLPVETGELLMIEPAAGRITARVKLPGGQVAGNLAAARGVLVSQSVREVVGFRSLSDIERQIEDALANSADDAGALALRGEVRLFHGDEVGGIADMRKSLALKPNRQASQILAGVLIGGLKRDFAHYQALIEEIDRVTVDPQQRAEFLQLVAEGLERQGDHVAAFGQYLKLTELIDESWDLERVTPVLAARGDRVVRGRAWTTYQKATSAERAQIDQLLRQHLERSVSAAESMDRDARFLRYFEGHPLTDMVRRRFIEQLPVDREQMRLHELRRLAESRAPQEAAYACAQLARWSLDRKELSRARPWLARLTSEYPAVSLGEMGSVSSVLQRWAKEFGDLWAVTVPQWPLGEIEPERHPVQEPSLRRLVRMEVVGPCGPEYEDWSFELEDELDLTIAARDAAGREQWSVKLPEELVELVPRNRPPEAAPRLFCAGRLLALSLGSAFAVFEIPADSSSPRLLWYRSLFPADHPLQSGLQMIQTEVMNSGRRRVYLGDRQHQNPLGQLLGLTADQLVYHLGTRVIAVDPQTGETLWVRNDAPRRVEGTVNASFATVFDTDRQQAIVLRAWDGVELNRENLPNPHDWLWFHGDRLLTLRIRRNALLAEFHELSSGRLLWSHELPLLARCTVVNHRELLCHDPQGNLLALSLPTGQVNWEMAGGPVIEKLGFLWAVKDAGRYCVVAGNSSPLIPDNGHIRPYDGTQTPFTGVVFQIDAEQRKVAWKVDVPATAFEVLQPATAPLLAFVGKVVPPPEQPSGVFPPPAQLSALFLDRRDGTVIYQTAESHAPGLFRWEVSGEHQQLTAHFSSWLIQFEVQSPPDN